MGKLQAAQQLNLDQRLDDEKSLAVREMHDRLQYERTSQDFFEKEHAASKAALQRAGCELRVLAAAIKALEAEAGPARPASAAGSAASTPPGKPAGAKPGARPASAKRGMSMKDAAAALKSGRGRGRG